MIRDHLVASWRMLKNSRNPSPGLKTSGIETTVNEEDLFMLSKRVP
jgi:hypothetical protein